MRNVAVAILLLSLVACRGQASKERLNFTYVKSGAKGTQTLTFSLGGKQLASYSARDLEAWDADVWQRGGRGAIFTVLGEEQIPGTNASVFSIENKGKQLSLDILTGKRYRQQPATSSSVERK